MSVKIISYDLGSPESSSDYEELIKYIKGLALGLNLYILSGS